jgi:hypothetical protein
MKIKFGIEPQFLLRSFYEKYERIGSDLILFLLRIKFCLTKLDGDGKREAL